MNQQIINQCASAIERMDVWIEKAERHAKTKGIDVEILIDWQLAPDMAAFGHQIRSACSYLEHGVAVLTGERLSYSQEESTIASLRALIRETIEFVRGAAEGRLDDLAGRMVRLPWHKEPIGVERFLVEIIFADVYFHVGNAYAILRQGGIDIGKRDYIGPLYPSST